MKFLDCIISINESFNACKLTNFLQKFYQNTDWSTQFVLSSDVLQSPLYPKLLIQAAFWKRFQDHRRVSVFFQGQNIAYEEGYWKDFFKMCRVFFWSKQKIGIFLNKRVQCMSRRIVAQQNIQKFKILCWENSQLKTAYRKGFKINIL